MVTCSVYLWAVMSLTLVPYSKSMLNVCTVQAQLHQVFVLDCQSKCSESLKWTLYSDRDVVLAQCERTSCWASRGFDISHQDYLKGNLSLTITDPDYRKRNVFVCECGDADTCILRLSIKPLSSAVQMKPGSDLLMDVPIDEPINLLYQKKQDSEEKLICWRNKTEKALHCGSDYTSRISLRNSGLTLTSITESDGGVYTIRDIQNHENIHSYTLAVKVSYVPVWVTILIVVLLLLVIGGLWMLIRMRMKKKRFLKVQISMNKNGTRILQFMKAADGAESGRLSNYSVTLKSLQKLKVEMKTLKEEFKGKSVEGQQVHSWYRNSILDVEELILFFSEEKWYEKRIEVKEFIQFCKSKPPPQREEVISRCRLLHKEIKNSVSELRKMEKQFNSESFYYGHKGWLTDDLTAMRLRLCDVILWITENDGEPERSLLEDSQIGTE